MSYINEKYMKFLDKYGYDLVYKIGGTIKEETGLSLSEVNKKFEVLSKEPSVKWVRILRADGSQVKEYINRRWIENRM